MDNVHRGTGEDKGSDSGTTSLPEPVRIIHKEQDSISAFCLNQVSDTTIAFFIYNNYIFLCLHSEILLLHSFIEHLVKDLIASFFYLLSRFIIVSVLYINIKIYFDSLFLCIIDDHI